MRTSRQSSDCVVTSCANLNSHGIHHRWFHRISQSLFPRFYLRFCNILSGSFIRGPDTFQRRGMRKKIKKELKNGKKRIKESTRAA